MFMHSLWKYLYYHKSNSHDPHIFLTYKTTKNCCKKLNSDLITMILALNNDLITIFLISNIGNSFLTQHFFFLTINNSHFLENI